MMSVKKYFLLLLILVSTLNLSAQNEVRPDGDKIVWVLLIFLATVFLFFVYRKKGNIKQTLFVRQRIKIELEKSRLYFPDFLTLTVHNIGNTDIDMDRPLLIFDNFWLKRKFRLKGVENRSFYPLYLVKGHLHKLNIDLNHFYSYDRKLKRFPKVKIILFNVKGRRLGSNSVYLRKTLIKY
jgi:Ca2+/Na+ antiporter